MDEHLVMQLIQTCASVAQLLRTRPVGSRKTRALDAMQSALMATEAYLAQRESGESQDRLRERTLATLWHQAGEAIRPIDIQMDNRFFMKEDYWKFPEQWSQQQIDRVGIGIKQVHQEILQMKSLD